MVLPAQIFMAARNGDIDLVEVYLDCPDLGHGGGNIARHKLRGREAYFFFLRAAGFLDGALRFFFAKSCDTSTSSSSSSET